MRGGAPGVGYGGGRGPAAVVCEEKEGEKRVFCLRVWPFSACFSVLSEAPCGHAVGGPLGPRGEARAGSFGTPVSLHFILLYYYFFYFIHLF